ncbi:MAG: phosphonate ABC transporter, permease protein PhnE [Steroidobacteraceae bacterium]
MNTGSTAPMPVDWPLRPRFRTSQVLTALLIGALLLVSAQRTQMDRLLQLSAGAIVSAAGIGERSPVLAGFVRIGSGLWPLQIAEATPIARLENFDRTHLPFGTDIVTRQTEKRTLDPETLQLRTESVNEELVVERWGYLLHVIGLMAETVEIALWGTILALILATPLAWLGARNYAPYRPLYHAARWTSSLLRSVPDLLAALFLVLAFGFGPIAGVLALGLHTAGFLGKFFAEDIENAPSGPQDALRATGASPIVVLRYAVLPQVLPSYVGYLQYILERNIRTATVIGIVGAGGIGQELKGRFELFDFGHVGTMLVVIFLTVVLLESLTARLRGRLL